VSRRERKEEKCKCKMLLRLLQIVDPSCFEDFDGSLRKFLKGNYFQKEKCNNVKEKTRNLELEIGRTCTIKTVKDRLEQIIGIPAENICVFFRGHEIGNDWHPPTSCPENERLVFTTAKKEKDGMLLNVCGSESVSEVLSGQHGLIWALSESRKGMKQGIRPELATQGSGGTYFLKNVQERRVACFKPRDEEPSAINNPRGLSGEAGLHYLRPGILTGESCDREVAAFITDRDGFSGVPPTVMVESEHEAYYYNDGNIVPKVGSFQRYIRYDCIASDLSASLFPVHEVHKIGILDIRMVNTDRNDSNLLVIRKNDKIELVPVDHGFCLPDRIDVAWCDFCWLDWPQARIPFNEETKIWISKMDIEADVRKLKMELNIREPCLRMMRIAGMLLKKGVKRNLCLHDIASILVRQDIDKPSVLEDQIERAYELSRMLLRNSRIRGARGKPPTKKNSQLLPIKFTARERTSSTSNLAFYNVEEKKIDAQDEQKKLEEYRKRTRRNTSRRTTEPLPFPEPTKYVSTARCLATSSSFSGDDFPDTVQVVPTKYNVAESKQASSSTPQLFQEYFYQYLDTLLDDIIQSMVLERERNRNDLKTPSAMRLKYPHFSIRLKNGKQRRPRIDSTVTDSGTFWEAFESNDIQKRENSDSINFTKQQFNTELPPSMARRVSIHTLPRRLRAESTPPEF